MARSVSMEMIVWRISLRRGEARVSFDNSSGGDDRLGANVVANGEWEYTG